MPHINFKAIGMTESTTGMSDFRSSGDNKGRNPSSLLQGDNPSNGSIEDTAVRSTSRVALGCASTRGGSCDSIGDKPSLSLGLSQVNGKSSACIERVFCGRNYAGEGGNDESEGD